MTEAEDSVPAPPFDLVPEPDETESDDETQDKSGLLAGTWPRWALVALFVAAVGLGQGIGLTMLFGDRGDRLSPESKGSAGKSTTAPSDHVQDNESDQKPQQEQTELHELDKARERFYMGDIEGPRRVATEFLLRQDGYGREETKLVSQAYTLLADVLRYEYERSLIDAEAE